MGMGKRIQEALDHLKLKQAWLVEAAGIDTGALSALIRRDSKRSEFSGQIADALGVHHRWLQSGEGAMWRELDYRNAALKRPALHLVQETSMADNLLHAPVTRKPVPVISLIRAGDFADINCHYEPGDGDQWETPDYKVGPRAWAHIVDGHSMDDGSADGFPHGSLIFADPDVGYDANSFVIAKDVGAQKATFKQLVTDNGKWYLRPLNSQYPIIPIDDPKLRVIAVVTEARNVSRKLK